jgi:hypothetical protein
MTQSTSTHERITMPPDASVFAFAWVHGTPRLVVRTMPVVAVVQELLDMLRDEQVPLQDAHRALQRAVRLLRVFAAEPTGRQTRRQDDDGFDDAREWEISPKSVKQAAASRRFATSWLHGSPMQAIRTEPVIAVVQELRDALVNYHPTQVAHSAVRRTVRLLNVFVTDDEQQPNPHQ